MLTSAVTETQRAHFARILPPGKEWYTAKEAAGIIGRSAQYVRDCFDNQKLMGHALNAKAETGKERRKCYQIHRDSLLLYLLETANYQSDDFLDRLTYLLKHLSTPERRLLRARLDALW